MAEKDVLLQEEIDALLESVDEAVDIQEHENKCDHNLINQLKDDLKLNWSVSISVEIGRTKMSIRNLLQLNQGEIVTLDHLAGTPLDVLVNDTLVAHGEVVVINDKLGVQLTDIVSKAERIKHLRFT